MASLKSVCATAHSPLDM